MRFARRKFIPRGVTAHETLRVGFVSTLECASLATAQELGLFKKQGLNVRLSREIGWGSIRDRLANEELDAVVGYASLLISMYCGWGGVRRSCLTGLLLDSNSNGITLSNELWEAGVRDAVSLGHLLREGRLRRRPNLGVVVDLGLENHLLRGWLRSGGVDPDVDVRVITVPSEFVFEAFRQGHLDGYCAAEPWNSIAVATATGRVAAVTSEFPPAPPGKALMVLRDFAEGREEEHLRLIAALIEASRICDEPVYRTELVRILARPEYLGLEAAVISNALAGPLETGCDRQSPPHSIVFDALKVGEPSRARGRSLLEMLRGLPRGDGREVPRKPIISRIFRSDLFDRAQVFLGSTGSVTPLPASGVAVDSGKNATKESGQCRGEAGPGAIHCEFGSVRGGRWAESDAGSLSSCALRGAAA